MQHSEKLVGVGTAGRYTYLCTVHRLNYSYLSTVVQCDSPKSPMFFKVVTKKIHMNFHRACKESGVKFSEKWKGRRGLLCTGPGSSSSGGGLMCVGPTGRGNSGTSAPLHLCTLHLVISLTTYHLVIVYNSVLDQDSFFDGSESGPLDFSPNPNPDPGNKKLIFKRQKQNFGRHFCFQPKSR